jgi:tetratricopeptide (TPR) repeat protein
MVKDYSFSNAYVARREILAIAGDIEGAAAILERYLELHDDPQGWALYGETLMMLGREASARAAFRCALGRWPSMHIKDVIDARAACTVAIVDDVQRVLYVPIPKCGSTTIKDYLGEAIFGEASGLNSHARMIRLQRVVSFADLETIYREYFRFAVLRSPADRLNSYYYGNIRKGLLRRDSWNRESLRGLSTEPSGQEFMKKFFEYRRIFPDVRNHTNPLHLYVSGSPIKYFDVIYGQEELEQCRNALERVYEKDIKQRRLMDARYDGERLVMGDDIVQFYSDEIAMMSPDSSSS